MKYLFLLLFAGQLAAQSVQDKINKIKNDPNITWAAEFYLEHEDLDGFCEVRNQDIRQKRTLPDGTIIGRQQQINRVLKLQSDEPTRWETYLRKATLAQGSPRYLDADLTKPMTKADEEGRLYFLDTINTFDPETFEPTKAVLANDFDPSSLISYSMRTILYYNKKDNFFYSLPLAIGAKALRWDKHGNTTGAQTLFWMPVAFDGAPIKWQSNPNIHMAKFVQVQDSFNMGAPIKGSHDEATRAYWEGLKKTTNKTFATSIMSNAPSERGEPLPQTELDSTLNEKYKEIQFDPETFEEIIVEKARTRDKSMFRIGHVIAWDAQRKQFAVSAYSFTLVEQRRNDNGDLLAIIPFFYVYPHRRTK